MPNPQQIAADTYILLGLAIVVLAFCAYELAGLTLPGMHTVSFIAAHHRWLYWAIFIAFVVGGVSAPLWWVAHISYGNISR